jgi:ribosomal protein S18 acetylase RimI-like enzyme
VSLRLSAPTAATPEALPEIVALLNRVFPQDRPRAPDLEWQYLKNPAGPARYVNAYDQSGGLIAHYALLPTPPLVESPGAVAGTYFSLNTAVDPAARIPGLMVATARALFRQIQAEGPAVVLGVANENSFQGFVRLLGFRPLGRLSLTLHLPGMLPAVRAPRALQDDAAHLAWRASRPGVACHGDPGRGMLSVRLRHWGLPLDAVLSTGLPRDIVEPLALPRPSPGVPRLYAGFGAPVSGGFPVPARLRPSPLEYIVRVLGDGGLVEPVAQHLASRRFEFLDFDVV